MTQRYLITDCEFGSYHKEASLTSCYMGIIESGEIIKELHYPKLIPDNGLITLSPEAMVKIGVDIRDWIDAVKYSNTANEVTQFLKQNRSIIGWKDGRPTYERLQAIGQGIDEDLTRIQDSLEHIELSKYIKATTIDTCKLARTLQDCGLLPDMAINLKSLADYFEIQFDDWHNEKSDAIMAYKVYEKMKNLIRGNRE